MPRKGRSTFNASRVHAARRLPEMLAVLRSRPLRMFCRNANFRVARSQPRSIVPALKNRLPPATPVQAVYGPAGKTETWQPVDAGRIGALVKALARNVFEAHMSKERTPGVTNWEAWKIGAFTAKAQPPPACGSQRVRIDPEEQILECGTWHEASWRSERACRPGECLLAASRKGETDSGHLDLRRGMGPLHDGAIRTHALVCVLDHRLRLDIDW